MRALQIQSWQSDPVLTEVPEPDPGPGEVVVRIGGSGACHSDLHLLHDFTEGMVPWDPPFTLGHENAGWVHALGRGVSDLEVGEPVAVYGPWGCGRCPRCRVGMENYCERAAEIGVAGGGLGRDGGMAPLMLVPSSRLLVPLGDLDPVEAAPLTDAALTPYHAIKRSAALLGPGSTTVVIGIGGLGHMGVQLLAATTPTRIIAVDTRDDALALARRAGAETAVAAGDDAPAAILDATAGLGADVVIDMVGSDESLALATTVARSYSHITVVGIGGGNFSFGFFSVPYECSVATTYWGSLPELLEVVELARRGSIRAEVTRVDLEGAAGAYEDLAHGRVAGRLVVVPGS
ncbi:NAD(P)-dependent alcohol dehydrogenase [Rhabdothermincola salaria]|uniref:NAD(P)-dependent alcohol dehydrogenase n=1 Tax=Rhabdothermincola salaria TaxID=2903142 RepID=UPI001E4E4797|nr:NAD(P)-dependent alcohol dehydrogenase [Rhabdothermincola salaria]MCD9623499.1 NAD(P)-dependent alcohol dehydrogenase [Rhabdothermincola salaria]